MVLPLMSNAELRYLAFQEVLFKVSLVEYGYLDAIQAVRNVPKCDIAGTFLFGDVHIFSCLNS